MMSRKSYYFIITMLFLLGVALMIYRNVIFEVPWFPSEQREIWSVEAKLKFQSNPDNDPVKLSFAIPNNQKGFTILSETPSSPGYGVNFTEEKNQRRAVYTTREATGQQEMFYTVNIMKDPFAKDQDVAVPKIKFTDDDDVVANARNAIINTAKSRSADTASLVTEIFKIIQSSDQNANLLLKDTSKSKLLTDLFIRAGIPARVVNVLNLKDKRRRQKLQDYVQFFDANTYYLLDPEQGTFGNHENILLWEYHSTPLIDLTGGRKAEVSFSMAKKPVPVKTALSEKFSNTNLINFSLDLLPLEEQAIFRDILLLPVGVLVVVFLRIVVGLKTSGTFMPVLIAMAFMKTHLLVGVSGLLLIVSIGLLIRFYLSRLNLLLVARISTVIITVIGIIVFLTVITFQFGITEGMKITFFPMIILSWTIERMSILWEEEGAKQVFVQGGGSLLVAILAYLAMSSFWVQHLTFNFLGLQLIIVAVVLLLGNYSGYRLSELKRFKPLVDEISGSAVMASPDEMTNSANLNAPVQEKQKQEANSKSATDKSSDTANTDAER